MAAPSNLASLLAPYAKARNLDLNALLAIAGHEGASGGIGDNGHAFGPFQLNDAGGVLTGKSAGTPQQKNAWAWSPAGIKFALDGIANVASGLHGAGAVRAIATRFERPANVQAEIQDALSHYGGGRGLTSSAPRPQVPSPGGGSSGFGLGDLISQTNEMLGLGSSPAIGNLLDAALGQPKPRPTRGRPDGNGSLGPAKPAPGLGDFKGGTSKMSSLDGVTVDSQIAPSVADIVRRFGVQPTSGLRSAGHNAAVGGARNSDHLRGDAVDFVGNPQSMLALYRYAQGRFPYVEPMGQAKNHVHISFRRPGA